MKKNFVICLLLAGMLASCQTEEIPGLSGEVVTGLAPGTRLIPALISVYQGDEFKGTMEPVYDDRNRIIRVEYNYTPICTTCKISEQFEYNEMGKIASVCNENYCNEYVYDDNGRLSEVNTSSGKLRLIYEDGPLPGRVEEFETGPNGEWQLRRMSVLTYDSSGNLIREQQQDENGITYRNNDFSYDDQNGIFSELTPYAYLFIPHFSFNNFTKISRVLSNGKSGSVVDNVYRYNDLGYPLEIRELVTYVASGETIEDEVLFITYKVLDDSTN